MLDLLLALDRELHVGTLVFCAVLGVLGTVVPPSRRVPALAAAAVIAVALLYREQAPAFALSAAFAFAAMHALARVPRAKTRWTATLFMIVAITAIFLAARESPLPDARAAVGGVRLAVYVFDMWMFLRVVSLFWEVGSGRSRRSHPCSTSYGSGCRSRSPGRCSDPRSSSPPCNRRPARSP